MRFCLLHLSCWLNKRNATWIQYRQRATSMKKQILALAFIFIVSTQSFAQVDGVNYNPEKRIVCGLGEAKTAVNKMVEDEKLGDWKTSMQSAGEKLRKEILNMLTRGDISAKTNKSDMYQIFRNAECVFKVISENDVDAEVGKKYKHNLWIVEERVKLNNSKMPSLEKAKTEAEINNARANKYLYANRFASAIVMAVFDDSHDAVKSTVTAKPDYFVGGDNKIVCETDEADMVVKNLANEAGKSTFKESIGLSINKLNKSLSDILYNKKVSGRSLEAETVDLIKKAACVAKVVSELPIKEDFPAMFQKNVLMVEGEVKVNMASMPSYADAATIEEQNNAVNNELILANRGVVAFVLTMQYKPDVAKH